MKKIFEQLKAFFGRLLNSEKPTSSKRFVALWCILLVTYGVIRYVSKDNLIDFVDATYIFVAALLGIGAVQSIIKDRNSK